MKLRAGEKRKVWKRKEKCGITILLQDTEYTALNDAVLGGEIFVNGNAGYRAGIYMKEYRDMVPVIIRCRLILRGACGGDPCVLLYGGKLPQQQSL